MRISDWSSDVCSSDLKPDERQLANYDPKSIIAPTLADAPNDPNAPVPMTEVPALDGSQAPRTGGANGRPQKSEGQLIAEAQRRAGIMDYGGEQGGGVGGEVDAARSEAGRDGKRCGTNGKSSWFPYSLIKNNKNT